MESDGTYMSDHQLFFLSDSYPKRQLLIICFCCKETCSTENKDRAEGKHLAVKRSDGWIPVMSVKTKKKRKEIINT